MKQLSQVDSLFVHNESQRAPLHISPLMIYSPPEEGGHVRFKDILEHFQQRLHKSQVFRRKLSRVVMDLDNPYWVEDEDFDLEFHVRHVALPKPGDWRQFCIMIARLHSRPLDLTRPPWEAFVIEGLDNINGLPKGCFAVFIKVHHCAMDGATGTQMIEALHDLTPDPIKENIVDMWRGEQEPDQLYKIVKAYLKLFKAPKRISELAKHAIKSRSAEVRKSIGDGPEDHGIKERTRFNDVVSPHRVFGGLHMELSTLKSIKNAVKGATLNDVVLSITAGAMRHYLDDKGELPFESLVVAVPINTRTVNASADGGNEVSGMRLNLRTDLVEPLQRLKAIHNDAVSSKKYAEAVGIERLSTTFSLIPPGITSTMMKLVNWSGASARAPFAHTILTNVPGPQVPLYMCGAKAVLNMGTGMAVDGMGLFHTVTSYSGTMCLAFVACRKMLPDPDVYHQCITRSLNEHLSAAAVITEASEPAGKVEGIAPEKTPKKAAKPKAAKKTTTKKVTPKKVTKKNSDDSPAEPVSAHG